MLALAYQMFPGKEPAENALSNIANQGILGALCVLLIVALVITLRALLKEKDSRFNDQKVMSETLRTLNEGARDLVLEMNRSISSQVLETTKSQESVRAVLNEQTRAQDYMTRSLESLQREQTRLAIVIERSSDHRGQ